MRFFLISIILNNHHLLVPLSIIINKYFYLNTKTSKINFKFFKINK